MKSWKITTWMFSRRKNRRLECICECMKRAEYLAKLHERKANEYRSKPGGMRMHALHRSLSAECSKLYWELRREQSIETS
jgi:hypothetical protein